MSHLNTPEGFLQIYWDGPSGGHNPPMVQLTVKIGEALVQAYLSMGHANWLGAELQATAIKMANGVAAKQARKRK